MAVSVQPSATNGGSVPPQNTEAETSVLGAILLTEQALDGVLLEAGLRAEDFYRPRHQLIFRSMVRLKEKAEPEAVDALTVCDDLRRANELEEAGEEAYIHSLPTVVPAVGNVLHYARIVKEYSLLRRLLGATRDIQDEVMGHRGDPRELIERAESALFKIGHDDGRGEMRSIEAVLHEEVDKLEALSRGSGGLTGTPTSFTDLDEITGGFQPGNLIVLAARPSMGKSTLATNMAENAAIDHGRPVALFSLEMSETELAHRFIASQAKISSDELRKGRVKGDRWPKVLKAVEKLAQAPIFIDDSSDIGILEIRAKARRLHARHGLGLLIVDYLQLMRPDGRADSRVEQIGQISRGLKILARELEIPVIAVSQLSRAVESRHPPIPMLSDLRECVTGDTLVTLADGRRLPIQRLVDTTPDVLAIDEEERIVTARSDKVWRVGRRPVLLMRLASGRLLRGTAEHRVLAGSGWRKLEKIEADERVALAFLGRIGALGKSRPQTTMRVKALAGVGATGNSDVTSLHDRDVSRHAGSDLFWDRVVSIEPDGEEDVFDLTVPGPACWLADGIVTHNSGQIEQDADVVMFVYRDEYYNRESERPGEADLIMAKHRNGPIGEVTMTFLPKYPRFANLYRDRGGSEPTAQLGQNGGG